VELGIKNKILEETKNEIKKRRLFVSLSLPEEVIDTLFELRKSNDNNYHVPWEPKEKIHLTLNFLGNVNEEKIPLIEQVLDETVMFKKVNTMITNFRILKNQTKPTALIAKVSAVHDLLQLQNYLSECWENLDIFIDKKPFYPHITLLRIKNNLESRFISAFKALTFENIYFQADEIVLYESILNPSGSTYKKLKSIYLLK